jgi:hypothetical protein
MRDGVLNVWKDEIVVSHFFKEVGDGKLILPIPDFSSDRMNDGQLLTSW